jgi:hypothetical protein
MTISIPNSLRLGAPGGVGASSIYIFADTGNPNSLNDPLQNLAKSSLGSLFIQTDSPSLWQKTGAATGSAPTGVWTAK